MLKSGIYIIMSTLDNGKIYVGSAVNLKEREKRHFRDLKKLKHFNKKLQHYYNKYGPDCFIFDVVQHIPPEYLIYYEQHYLDTLKPYFNINPKAGSRFGAVHSIETKLKIKTSLLGNKNTSMLRHLWRRVVKQRL